MMLGSNATNNNHNDQFDNNNDIHSTNSDVMSKLYFHVQNTRKIAKLTRQKHCIIIVIVLILVSYYIIISINIVQLKRNRSE